MAVVIESIIKSNPIGKWYIELRDTTEDDKFEICLDIDEYAEKIEKMGEEYGGDIQVAWSAEDNVTKEQINEVRMQINAYEAKRESELNESSTHQADGTPKF
jgi:hypothetical protein